MKKLIIAAAIAAGALVSQAASFSWVTSGKAYAIDSTTMTAGLAAGQTYGVGSNNASSMYNQITSFGAVWSYVITLTDGVTSEELSGTLVAADFSSRYVNETSGLATSLFDGATGDDPITINYSIVLTGNVTDGLDKNWTITSDTIAGTWKYSGVGDLKLSTVAASSWSTAAVPEPTSGLLMLLGMAGLALRRRRA